MSREINLIKKVFGDAEIRFLPNGWFCATDAAKLFGKRVINWLDLPSTSAYLNGLRVFQKSENMTSEEFAALFINAKRGNNASTWLHPKLAIRFASWLDIGFGIWCDSQIEHILLNERDQIDWEGRRRLTKDANIEKNSYVAQLPGYRKEDAARFHIKHACMLNTVFVGKHTTSVDRDGLDEVQLTILNDLERFQSTLLDMERYVRGLDSVEQRYAMMDRCNECRVALGLEAFDYSEVIRKMEAARATKSRSTSKSA